MAVSPLEWTRVHPSPTPGLRERPQVSPTIPSARSRCTEPSVTSSDGATVLRSTWYPKIASLVIMAWLTAVPAADAQEPTLEQLGRANRNFGMDSATLQRLLGPAFRQRGLAAVTSTTPEQLADQVSEVRIFLGTDRNVVTGELAISGRTRLTTISIPMEQSTVTFNDLGRPPDRTRGDGVFTARFPLNTEAAWQTLRPLLAASAQATRSPAEGQFIRRGPRDLVPAREGLVALQRQSPATFAALTQNAERAAQLGNLRTLGEALRVLGVRADRTAFLSIPGPGFDPRERFQFRRVFDIPVLDIFPIPSPPVPIDEARTLMIVHPGVVDNPGRTFDACTAAGTQGGPWSFGHLMRELSFGTGMTPEDFTQHWLSSWILLQEANSFLVSEPGRAAQLQSRVIASWQRLSGATLDVDQFPARLLAIVNRPDLADKIGYGVAGSAGEGRFVFGLVERPAGGGCINLPFTVIFEYGITGGSCTAVKAWHQRWKDLENHTLGSSAYNAALELITRDFTDHGSNPGQLPNESSLNQLRTNENALDPTWQLREFRLQSAGAVPPGLMDLVTVKQTPADVFQGTATVTAYIVANEAAILANKHVVPERFPTIFNPFMGARSNVPFPPNNVFWNAPGLTAPPMADPAEARRKFSLSTCNACHGGETSTFFTHIGNVGTRNPGSPAALSGFLTGIDVTVPVTGGIHHYADLAEREAAMSNILTSSCAALLGVRRIPFVH